MIKSWPLVPLGEVVQQRKEFVTIDDTQEYKRCRVQLHAKGIVLRDILPGAEIKTKEQQVCRAGEFSVAEIDAKVGGFGIVPEDLEGAIVSSHYFLFNIDGSQLDRRFLDYFIRTPAFREQVTAQGTTNYAAIRPAHVLGYTIPLPPVPEQRRIVAKVEELATKIAESQSIRQRLVVETDSVPSSVADSVFDSVQCTWRTIDELVGRGNLRNGKSIKPMDILTGVQCIRLSALENGRINCRDAKPVAMTEEEAKPYLMKPGDVFVMRGNGSKHLVGRAGLVEGTIPGTIFPDLFIRIPLEGTGVSSHFFVRFWNSRQMRTVIENTCKTTSGIWKINQGHIASFSIPVPLPSEQRRIVAHLDDLQAKVNALKTQQAESAAELDAMLPSILDKAFKGKL